MNWLVAVGQWARAALAAARAQLSGGLVELADYLRSHLAQACERWWLAPVAGGLAVALAVLAPQLSAGLVTVLFDMPSAHPVARMALDLSVLAASLLIVSYWPLLAVVLAAVPIGSLLNSWVSRVQLEYQLRLGRELAWRE